MTDRELLEGAAKAAGIALFDGGPDVRVPDECQARVWDREGALTILFYSDAGDNPLCKRVRPSGNVEWNPLTDDGDALRLAVRLRIHITMSEYGRVVCRQGEWTRAIELYGDDANAATRRAIVKAAAEIAHSRDGSPGSESTRPDEQDAPGSSIVLGAEGEQ